MGKARLPSFRCRSFGSKLPPIPRHMFPVIATTVLHTHHELSPGLADGLAGLSRPLSGPGENSMKDRELYSIEETRELLGGISRNTIYAFLRTGDLASVVIGCRRFISAGAIHEFVQASTTRVSPSRAAVRDRKALNQLSMLPVPRYAPARAAERGQHAILPSPRKR